MDRVKNNNSSILVLGAGRDQVFLIKTAKDMGLYVCCVDVQNNSPGAAYADQFFNIRSRDIQGLERLIDKLKKSTHPIKGVITMGSDIPHIVAQLSEYAGTPSITLDSALGAKNKLLMKQKFKLFGVSSPKFSAVSSFSDLENTLGNFNSSKIVLKPIDQAGSRGVALTEVNSENLKELYLTALSHSDEKLILIEEFIPGPQISTEHVIYEGNIYTPGFADRNYDDLERFLPQIMENGGWVPSKYFDYKESIEREICKAVKALNLNNCIVKGDVVLRNGQPMIVEIAARLSGGDFSESLVPISTGVNYVKTAIELCMGNQPDLGVLKGEIKSTVANRYFFAGEGQLKAIDVKFDAKNFSWLNKLEFWVKPGDRIGNINSHGARSGVFVVSGKDRNDVNEKIDFIYKNVKFIYE